jgi:WD40 repeat protein
VVAVAFSPDGKNLVSGSERTLRLWDVASGQMRKAMQGRSWDGCKA